MTFKVTPEISELAGFFAADGSMQKAHISFWGDIDLDKHFYDNRLKSLFLNSFKFNINPHEKPSNSVYGFYICNREIIRFFNEALGFPFGKKTYSLKVPDIIYSSEDEEILCAFLRGFFA